MEDKRQLLNELTDSGQYTVEVIKEYDKVVITSCKGSITANIKDIEYIGNSCNVIEARINGALIEFFYNGLFIIHLDEE